MTLKNYKKSHCSILKNFNTKLVLLVQKNRLKNDYCCSYKVTKQGKCAYTIKKNIFKNLNYTKANQNRESIICQQKYPRYVNSRIHETIRPEKLKKCSQLCVNITKKWNLYIQKVKTNKFEQSNNEILA